MNLKLMTPERTLFEGEVVSVAGRSAGGEFEIHPNHGTWVSPTEAGALSVRLPSGGQTLHFVVHGGLIEVRPVSVLVLADAAEAAEDVDEARAERARARAEERLRLGRGTDAEEVDVDRARRALARALARLEAQVVRR